MTTVSEQLYQQAQRLPESVQLEVLHYMEALSAKLPKFYKTSQEASVKKVTPENKNAHLYDEPMPIYTEEERQQRQKKAHEILAYLATQPQCYQGIDVMAWQKEQRQDRPLPFRDAE